MAREIYKDQEGHIRERLLEVTYKCVPKGETVMPELERTVKVISDELCTDTAIISRYWVV